MAALNQGLKYAGRAYPPLRDKLAQGFFQILEKTLKVVMGKGMPMPAFARPPTFFGNARFAHALIILNGQMPALPMPVLCVPGQPEGRSWH